MRLNGLLIQLFLKSQKKICTFELCSVNFLIGILLYFYCIFVILCIMLDLL